ncbi:Ig-like domain-containing protein [Deinococcus sp. A31D244]|uniref:Ig-like domain-containing protein n=1 Tax=Deinococcus sp. A31D244 TaxID=3397675 RepID=UPI0039E19E5B
MTPLPVRPHTDSFPAQRGWTRNRSPVTTRSCGAAALLLAALSGCTPPRSVPAQDDVPPVVTLGLGTPLSQSAPGVVHLLARASDESGVAGVTFRRGGQLLGTDRAAPFEWTDPLGSGGTYRYGAEATDGAGNTAEQFLEVTITLPPGLTGVRGAAVQYAGEGSSGPLTQPWAGGAASLVLINADAGTELERSTLTGAGAFTLPLPTLAAGSGAALSAEVLGLSCDAPPTFSVPDARAVRASVTVGAQAAGLQEAAPLSGSVTSVNGVPKETLRGSGGLLFSDRPVQVSGTVACVLPGLRDAGGSEVRGNVTFGLNLLRGWNAVSFTRTVNSSLPPVGVLQSVQPPAQWVVGGTDLPWPDRP